MKIYNELEQLLLTQNNYVSDDGKLKKYVVIAKAQNFDSELLELLLSNKIIKEQFFKEVSTVLVFNQNLFIQYLEYKNYLKTSYTAFRNKVGLTIGDQLIKQRNEVELVWPYKDCVLEGGQSREELKRDEIFFNQTLAQDEINQLFEPKVLTNAKVYSANELKVFEKFNRNEKGTITDNLIIKGNNLLALHSLKVEFAGKVKLIYIDPPYNTGNDSFGYNDNFNHSTWLTFMRNRLIVAKELLREDGLIFIQCDDNEQAYLKVLCDEVFKSNFVNTICVQMSNLSGHKIEHAIQGRKFPKIKEYIHIYSSNKTKYKLNIPKYKKKNWDNEYNLIIENFTKEDFKNYIFNIEQNNELELNVIFKDKICTSLNDYIKTQNIGNLNDWLLENSFRILASKPNTALRKIALNNKYTTNIAIIKNQRGNCKIIKTDFNRDSNTARIELVFAESNLNSYIGDIWFNITTTGGVAQEGGVILKNGKKPEELIKIIINSTSKLSDIVLDFHLGSGTTAAVAHKMNRQYIGIEQLYYGENDSIVRLQNVIDGDSTGISKAVNWQGGGSFVYLELKKHNQNFIEDLEVAKDTTEILAIWNDMKSKSFIDYNVDIKKQDQHIDDFKQLSVNEQKQHLVSILDKNQLYVNLSELKNQESSLTEKEIVVTKDFYQIKK